MLLRWLRSSSSSMPRYWMEAGADAGTDAGLVLTDAAGEGEQVETTQGGTVAADVFFDLVTEVGDGFGGSFVTAFFKQQVFHVGAGFGDAEQAGLMVDEPADMFHGYFFFPHKTPGNIWIEVAGPGAHGQTAGWGESHAGVDGLLVPDGGDAGAVAEVG